MYPFMEYISIKYEASRTDRSCVVSGCNVFPSLLFLYFNNNSLCGEWRSLVAFIVSCRPHPTLRFKAWSRGEMGL